MFGPPASAYEKFLRTGNLSYLYQMATFDVVVVTIYFALLAVLSFYGLHRYIMVFLYYRNRAKAAVANSTHSAVKQRKLLARRSQLIARPYLVVTTATGPVPAPEVPPAVSTPVVWLML